jgi:23S rRNA (uridine2552-2'-O)-methyltransferase
VKTAVVDLLAPDALERIRALHPGRFRLVTSDMAPKTIGVKVTDEARSLELVRMALRVAEDTLARGGALVAKVFMGGDFPALKTEFAERFAEVHVARPAATREHSYEVYVLGKGFRGAPPSQAARPSTGSGRAEGEPRGGIEPPRPPAAAPPAPPKPARRRPSRGR